MVFTPDVTFIVLPIFYAKPKGSLRADFSTVHVRLGCIVKEAHTFSSIEFQVILFFMSQKHN